MKKQYLFVLIILLASSRLKADKFTITLISVNDVPLIGTSWILTDTLDNTLASGAGFDSSFNSTTVYVTGGPYLLKMFNGNVESVLVDVFGSTPYTYNLLSPLSSDWVISNKFWASFANEVSFGDVAITQFSNHDFLNFNTYSETNSDKFIVQQSSDGIYFKDLDEIKSKSINGNCSTELNYEFRNYNIIYGTNSYRIKQLDKDGKFSFSKVVSIERNLVENRYMIYPNPIVNEIALDFELSNADLMEVQLFSLNGTFLRKLYSGKPTRHLETDLNNLQSGYYYVQVILDNEIVYSNTVLKD